MTNLAALRDDKVHQALGATKFMRAEAEGTPVPYKAMLADVRAWLEIPQAVVVDWPRSAMNGR
jgi:hypothetical protein